MPKLRHLLVAAGSAGAVALGAFALIRTRRELVRRASITATVTINRSPREVYEFFRDFSRLPEFMTYLDSVVEDGESSAWTAKLPLFGKLRWTARISEDVPGKLIAWEAEPGSRIAVSGRVTFTKAPGRQSTEVRAEMRLAGSSVLARLLASPETKGDLRRLKQVLETGEVLRSDASAHLMPHAAQPAVDAKPPPDFYIPHVPNVSKGAVS